MRIAAEQSISFLDAIRQIAMEMLDGESVDARISRIAGFFRQDRSSVHNQVLEMVDVLKD
jgi:adenylylsulfate kinase-like enzyme